jgi:tetratricopeptide (TPR) repeat protein
MMVFIAGASLLLSQGPFVTQSTTVDSLSQGLSYFGAPYYSNTRTIMIAIDSGPNGRPEFKASQTAIQSSFGLNKGDVRMLWDGQATKDAIESSLRDLAARSTKADRVIVDIVGHGYIGANGKAYLLAVDSVNPTIDTGPGLVPMESILQLFRAIPARHKWLVLDACYAGFLRKDLDPGNHTVGGRRADILKVRDQVGVAIWLGSYDGERTRYTPGGLTDLHESVKRAAEMSEWNQDLEALRHGVEKEGGKIVIGSMDAAHGQMLLGPPPSRVSNTTKPITKFFNVIEPDSVIRAVEDLSGELLQPGRTDEERARLQIELARAHRQWPKPAELPEHFKEAIKLIEAAKDVLGGSERLIAIFELAEALSDQRMDPEQFPRARAIDLYEECLKGLDPVKEAAIWGMIHQKLGTIYLTGGMPLRTAIPKAIEHLHSALTVFPKATNQHEWATLQQNLGNAYLLSVNASDADIRSAIQAFQASLEVQKKQDDPAGWAATQSSLGTAYLKLSDETGQSAMHGISCLEQALDVYTREAYPSEWATIQNNLGGAYRSLRPMSSFNLKRAAKHFTLAMEVRTKEKYPVDWATTEFNLGNVYGDLREDILVNRQKAKDHYSYAQTVFTRSRFPEVWALINTALGSLYIDTQHPSNSIPSESLPYYRAALEVYDRKRYPAQWANIQFLLGDAHVLMRPSSTNNFAEAIRHYRASLEVFTRDAHLSAWTRVQNNLGVAYKQLPGGGRESRSAAIACFANILASLDRSKVPASWARAAHNLAALRFELWNGQNTELNSIIELEKGALSSLSKSGDPVLWANCKIILGKALRRRHPVEYATALGCFRDALATLDRNFNSNVLGDVTFEMAICVSRLSKNRKSRFEAVHLLKRSLEYRLRGNSGGILAETLAALGSEYEKLGDKNRAKASYRKARDLYRKSGETAKANVCERRLRFLASHGLDKG